MKKSLLYSAMIALPLLAGCNSSSNDDSSTGPSDGVYDREGEIVEFLATPYLQYPTNDGMTVMFEPLLEEEHTAESTVYYRQQGSTGPYTPMQTVSSSYDSLELVQRARLQGLKSDTRYDYFVRTPSGDSKVYNFRTWPSGADLDNNGEYTFVAMSDTHASTRDAWGEGISGLINIYEKGIIRHECLDDIENCNDLVSGILVAGDMVYASSPRQSYRDFFNSSLELAAYVPILTTPGNHEHDGGNIESYDIYLDWPEQMGWDKARYTYSLDFLNLRMFFYDSFNKSQGGSEYQYDWTKQEIENTVYDNSIDYVLGVTHAPCQSSMWISGESEKSCEFVDLLHAYTAESGNLSGHIFGHTHSYTRGNAMDVAHVALNVATAVGRLDHFAEFAQKDYDTVALSNDEDGYNVFTLTATGDKEIAMIRRNGGSFYRGFDHDFPIYDTQVYTVTNGPSQPAINTFEFGAPGVIHLDASEFQGLEDTDHYETHWQLSTSADFDEDISDIWGNTTRAYNWWYNEDEFFDDNGNRIFGWCNPYAAKDEECDDDKIHTRPVDTQAGVDITKHEVVAPTAPGNTIYARVRYRDNNLNWSEWSASADVYFEAGDSTENLIQNPGGETGTTEGWTHWSKAEGNADGSENALKAIAKGSCGIPTAHDDYIFHLGNIGSVGDPACNGHGYGFGGFAYQEVDATEALEGYDMTQPLYVNYSAYMMNWSSSNDDPIELYVEFFDPENNMLARTGKIKANSPKELTKYSGATAAPIGTQFVRLILESTHVAGTDTDSQFDDVELTLTMVN